MTRPDEDSPTEAPGSIGRIAALVARIRDLEREIEAELSHGREGLAESFRYRIEHGTVAFEEAARRGHLKLRMGVATFLREASLKMFVSLPFIYAMLVPVVLMDVAISMYQPICSRLYGIPRVSRRSYVTLDRRHLAYLNWIEKLNCDYCSYANGVLAYAREVASRTEQFWCPIKHARGVLGTHDRYRDFLEYGDAEGWTRRLPVLRDEIRNGK